MLASASRGTRVNHGRGGVIESCSPSGMNRKLRACISKCKQEAESVNWKGGGEAINSQSSPPVTHFLPQGW